MKKSFWIVNGLICLGAVSMLAGLGGIANKSAQGFSTGLVGVNITLQALAVKSAKKRKLGMKNNYTTSLVYEFSLIALGTAALYLQNDIKYRLASDPIPFVFHFLGLVVYLAMFFRRASTDFENSDN